MKTNLLKSALLLLAVTCSVNMMATDFEIDLRNGQLGTDKTNPTTKYLTIDGETYTYADEAPAEYVAILSAAKYNGTQHGYQDLLVTIPVVAGNYKVTLGTCQYFNGSGSVTNEDGSVTLKSFNQNTGVCYHNNTSSNVIYVTFSVDQDQTIKVDCGNYTPYIKFEQLADIEYIVTFSNNDAEAEGTVPAVTNVGGVDGNNYFYTEEPLVNLGAVSGAVTLTINGNSNIGHDVFGGGDSSAVINTTNPANASTTVKLQGNAQVQGNVFGGGNRGLVSGTATVNVEE